MKIRALVSKLYIKRKHGFSVWYNSVSMPSIVHIIKIVIALFIRKDGFSCVSTYGLPHIQRS